ncbi:MAG: thioredoxin family protein [Pseudomonadota bacterium]
MAYFSDRDLQQIDGWAEAATGPMTLTCVLTGHGCDRDLETFCRNLSMAVPAVTWKTEKAESGLPHIRISETMKVSAVPMDRELAPFLEALSLVREGASTLSPDLGSVISSLDIPVRLKVYIAPQCPHCPVVVRSLFSLAAASDRIRLHLIDGTLFTREAQADSILSVPCIILDDDFRWTGNVSQADVVDMIVTRDPFRMSGESLKLVLEEGRASWIADQMIRHNRLFPGLIPLLTHPGWSVRLGAMVVVEGLAAGSPDLAADLAAPLWEVFAGADITVKGDILYALGEVGDEDDRLCLKGLISTLDEGELREAAEDAVESIEMRLGGKEA